MLAVGYDKHHKSLFFSKLINNPIIFTTNASTKSIRGKNEVITKKQAEIELYSVKREEKKSQLCHVWI